MIIPNFRCRQDDQFIYIEIKAVNAKLERTEFDINDNVIVFTSPPYHLRINLPGEIIYAEQDDDNCRWNSDTNEFILKLKKLNENEHFNGLDLISKLLTTEDQLNKKNNLIELIDQENKDYDFNNYEDDILNNDDNLIDFRIDDYEQSTKSILNTKYNYGFLNKYSNLIEKYQDELWQLSDLKNPGEFSIKERRELRIKKENNDFDEEHYLSDQYDDTKLIDDLRLLDSKWLELKNFEYTDDELFRLKNLAKKEFKLTKEEKLILLYGIIDILYAYCYDKRINEGDQSPESAWTISKLSSTFSWFDTFWSSDGLIESCLRRSLIYALYRNYELSKSILNDVIKILNNGHIHIIKCLLDIQKMFNEYGDFKYLINDLYVNDYIIAIQYLDKKYFNKLIQLINDKLNSITKDKLNLDLLLLDQAAESVILDQFNNLDI